MRQLDAYTAKDVTKTGNSERLTSTGNRKIKMG